MPAGALQGIAIVWKDEINTMVGAVETSNIYDYNI
jgi:hypothetical protein